MNNGIMQCGRKLYDSRVESRILDRQHTGFESHHMNLMMFIEKKLYGRKKKERKSNCTIEREHPLKVQRSEHPGSFSWTLTKTNVDQSNFFFNLVSKIKLVQQKKKSH